MGGLMRACGNLHQLHFCRVDQQHSKSFPCAVHKAHSTYPLASDPPQQNVFIDRGLTRPGDLGGRVNAFSSPIRE